MESWDAVETVARIRRGEVSALEVLEATIQRAEAAGVLNAIVTDAFECARARASNGPLEGAFAGLPTFIKDLSQVKGVRTRYDVLVLPSVAAPAPLLGHLATDLPYETHYDRVRTFAAFTPLHNVAGAPAISLPLGRGATGLPLGVQFAAARGHEALLLELAQTLEAAHPWPRMAASR